MQYNLRTSCWPEQQFDLAKKSEVFHFSAQGLQSGLFGREAGRKSRRFAATFTAPSNLFRGENALACGPGGSTELLPHTTALNEVDTNSDDHLTFGTTNSALRMRSNSAAIADLRGEKMTCRDMPIINWSVGTVGALGHG